LGWREVNVWVKADLSTKLTSFLAEREDQTNVKPYTVAEMADLYEELKKEIAADAARRKQATQFGPGGVHPGVSGPGNLPGPVRGDGSGPGNLPGPLGDAREQAASMIGAGYKTMDKVAAMRQIAADATRSDAIRDQAVNALRQIEQDAPVDPLFLALRSVVRIDDLERIALDESEPAEARDTAREGATLLRKLEAANARPDDLDRAARAALDRVKAITQPKKKIPVRQEPKPPAPIVRNLKWFTWTWDQLKDWTTQIDPQLVAVGLNDDQWAQFQQTVANTITFRDTVAALRAQA